MPEGGLRGMGLDKNAWMHKNASIYMYAKELGSQDQVLLDFVCFVLNLFGINLNSGWFHAIRLEILSRMLGLRGRADDSGSISWKNPRRSVGT